MDERAHADGLAVVAGFLRLGVDERLGGRGGEFRHRRKSVREGKQTRLHAGLLQALFDGRRIVGDVLLEEVFAIAGKVGKGLRADLHGRHERVETASERRRREPGGGKTLRKFRLERVVRLARDVFAVHPEQFLEVETRRRGLAAVEGEGLDELLAAHHLAVVSGRPAEEHEEVEERLRQVPLFLELADERRAVALRVGLALRVHDHRQVRVLRHGRAEGLEDLDVLEGVLDVVVAADDVRDALLDVVHDVGDVEDGRTVGTDDDEILRVFGLLLHVPLHEVVVLDAAFLRHAEEDDFAGLLLARGGVHGLLDGLVGGARREELLHGGEVVGGVVRLVDHLFVVVEAEPRHRVEHLVDRLLRGAHEIGVLDAQEELSADVAGVEPVEDGGADVADVDGTGWRRGETDSDVGHGKLRKGLRTARRRARPAPLGAAAAES